MAAKHRTRQHRALQRVLYGMRQEKGFTQVNLARLLGRPQSYVSKYDSGERKLDLPELEQICGVLEVSLETFVRRYTKEAG